MKLLRLLLLTAGLCGSLAFGSLTPSTGVLSRLTAMSGALSEAATSRQAGVGIESVTVAPPTSLYGGYLGVFNFRVNLTANAPPGGVSVGLTSSNPHLWLSESGVLVKGGTRSALVVGVPAAVYTNETGQITATLNGSSASSPVVAILAPTIKSVSASLATLTGGAANISSILVTLTSPPPAGGLDVQIVNNQPSKLSTPTKLHIDPVPVDGYTKRAKVFTASAPVAVDAAVNATLSVTYGVTKQVVIQVTPPKVASFTLSPATVQGTSGSTATITLDGPAGPSGLKVSLTSADPATAAFIGLPLRIPAGQSSGTVQVKTFHVDAPKAVTLTAKFGTTLMANLNVVPPGSLQSVTLDHNTVVGGSSTAVFGTVTLVSPAGPGGKTVALSSSDPSAIIVPASVTVPSGATQIGFTVTHYSAWVAKTVTVSATADSVVQTSSIIVKPAGKPWTKYHGDARNTGRGNRTSATGALDWRVYLGTVYGAPALGADGTIYAQAYDGYLYAVDGTSHTIKWRFRTFALNASPLVGSDGTIYVGSTEDSAIYAITPAGNQKWSSRTPYAAVGIPAISNDGKLLFVGCGQWMHAYDTSDGTEKWEYGPVNRDYVLGAPAIGTDGTLYYGTDNGIVYALDPNTGKLKWRYMSASVGFRDVCMDNGILYVGAYDGIWAFNSSNGSLRWSYPTVGKVNGNTIVGTDGTVYVCSVGDNRLSYIYAFNGSTGALKWQRTDLPQGQTLAITDDGTLFISSGGSLYALKPGTGATKWTYKPADVALNSYSCAIGADGSIYIGAVDHYLYKIK